MHLARHHLRGASAGRGWEGTRAPARGRAARRVEGPLLPAHVRSRIDVGQPASRQTGGRQLPSELGAPLHHDGVAAAALGDPPEPALLGVQVVVCPAIDRSASPWSAGSITSAAHPAWRRPARSPKRAVRPGGVVDPPRRPLVPAPTGGQRPEGRGLADLPLRLGHDMEVASGDGIEARQPGIRRPQVVVRPGPAPLRRLSRRSRGPMDRGARGGAGRPTLSASEAAPGWARPYHGRTGSEGLRGSDPRTRSCATTNLPHPSV